jgi:hypothetical protein
MSQIALSRMSVAATAQPRVKFEVTPPRRLRWFQVRGATTASLANYGNKRSRSMGLNHPIPKCKLGALSPMHARSGLRRPDATELRRLRYWRLREPGGRNAGFLPAQGRNHLLLRKPRSGPPSDRNPAVQRSRRR